MSYKYKRIASGDANSTVTVCATSCILKSITINTTSAHALTVKEVLNPSSSNTVATIAASPVIGSVFEYNVDIEGKLTIDIPASYAGDATIAFQPL
jgi:hypothetical protein